MSSSDETALLVPPPTLAGYLRILWRRKWVVLQGLFLGPLVAFVISAHQSPLYEASAGVLLSQQRLAGVASAPPSQPEDPARVVQNEAEVARALPVAQRVVRATGQAFPNALSLLENSSVSTSTGSDVLSLSVRHTSPGAAARVVNEYARQFIVYLQNFETRSVTRALAQVQRRLAEMRGKPADRALYNALRAKQQEFQILEALETRTASLVHVAAGASKVRPLLVRNLILGIGLGLLLGIGTALLWDGLDGQSRSEEEVAELLGLPLLGRVRGPEGRLGSGLTMLEAPHTDKGEAFRTLRARLDVVTQSRNLRSILVTSALDRDGRSTTVANLAVAFARSGRRVLLADFDLRYPSLDRLFGLEGRPGVTDVMLGHWPLADAFAPVPVSGPEGMPTLGGSWARTNGSSRNGRSASKPSAGSLHVLPAGPVSPSLRESFVSPAGAQLLESLRERADLLLVDAPPLLSVGDAHAFASHVDAVLVVVKSSVVETRLLKQLRRRVEMGEAVPVGFVLFDEEHDRRQQAQTGAQRPRRHLRPGRRAGTRQKARVP